jgi:hypothetical protein
MATHFSPHPQFRHPVRWFALEHPYASEWALIAMAALIGFLLWYWNT